jgi:hypothetical protein
VSAAGDVVHHREVRSTHHETHIDQRESAVGAFMRSLTQVANPHKEEEETIHQECQQASHSDTALLAFVTKQISAIDAVPILGAAAQGRLTQARYSTSMYALEIVEQRNGKRPDVLARIDRMREKLSALASSQKRRPLLMIGVGMAILFVLLGVCFAMAILTGKSSNASSQSAMEKVREADHLWHESLVDENETYSIDQSRRPDVYQRLIEFEERDGNTSRAKYYREKANRLHVPL